MNLLKQQWLQTVLAYFARLAAIMLIFIYLPTAYTLFATKPSASSAMSTVVYSAIMSIAYIVFFTVLNWTIPRKVKLRWKIEFYFILALLVISTAIAISARFLR